MLLNDKGYHTDPGETLSKFLRRTIAENVEGVSINRIIELHYQYRFAADPLSTLERSELRDDCRRFAQSAIGYEQRLIECGKQREMVVATIHDVHAAP